jgi:phosphoadenosine phosphosulfate reductase
MIEDLKNLDLNASLQLVANRYPGKVVFSSSFGLEDQVLIDAIWQNNLDIEIFTLDTGRLFPETYELMDKTKVRYNKSFTTYFPAFSDVEALVKEKGFNCFYESVENRKACCAVRKINPLKRALIHAEVWITGVRAEQSENRENMPIWEYDATNKVFKFNPLLAWTQAQVDAYLSTHNVPQNTLHKKGFISIGCQPCTRAIIEGEHPRAGRWWWENSQKECGLHSIK